MSKNTQKLGHLNANQFAIHCKNKGIALPTNHIEWILTNGFIQPVTSLNNVNFYNEYKSMFWIKSKTIAKNL